MALRFLATAAEHPGTRSFGLFNQVLAAGRFGESTGAPADPDRQKLTTIAPRLLILAIAVGGIFLLRGGLAITDVIVLAIPAFLISRTSRCAGGFAFVALWLAGYPPLMLPTYWISVAPLFWLWRTTKGVSFTRSCLEAIVLGFAVAWLSTRFVRDGVPAHQTLAHGIGCLLFGLQLIPLALCARWSREWGAAVGALACALVCVLTEFIQAHFGVAWAVMSISLPAAPAPIAQWSHLLTQFGVSGIFYFCAYLSTPDWTKRGWSRWRSSVCALLLIVALSSTGTWLRSLEVIKPLPFCAIIVQPHWKPGRDADAPMILDRLTRSELRTGGPVDLIVWPETSLAPSASSTPLVHPALPAAQLSLPEFAWLSRNEYKAAGLAGVPIQRREIERRYGLDVPCQRTYNCAALVPLSDNIVYQEKLALVPFREQLPSLFDGPWTRNYLLPFFGFEGARWSPGEKLRLMTFRLSNGQLASVVAPICYESYLPWLPHYRETAADAIVHLTYDGDFAECPEYAMREIWACQYRAIETRKWTLLCTTWAGSAVIDPTGRVRGQLDAAPGVLRTDRID
jgi:apolipoprotein N-acyltransferase